MNLHVQGRRSGKTTKILEWAANAPEDETRVIIFPTMDMARHAEDMAERIGYHLKTWQFLAPPYLGSLRGRRNVKVAVDELESVLSAMMGGFPIEEVTLTNGDPI